MIEIDMTEAKRRVEAIKARHQRIITNEEKRRFGCELLQDPLLAKFSNEYLSTMIEGVVTGRSLCNYSQRLGLVRDVRYGLDDRTQQVDNIGPVARPFSQLIGHMITQEIAKDTSKKGEVALISNFTIGEDAVSYYVVVRARGKLEQKIPASSAQEALSLFQTKALATLY
jgi:hypothetical protein